MLLHEYTQLVYCSEPSIEAMAEEGLSTWLNFLTKFFLVHNFLAVAALMRDVIAAFKINHMVMT